MTYANTFMTLIMSWLIHSTYLWCKQCLRHCIWPPSWFPQIFCTFVTLNGFRSSWKLREKFMQHLYHSCEKVMAFPIWIPGCATFNSNNCFKAATYKGFWAWPTCLSSCHGLSVGFRTTRQLQNLSFVFFEPFRGGLLLCVRLLSYCITQLD